MQHQKAVYLQEMGITHWQVRKPELFTNASGKKTIDLSAYSILVLIEEEEFNHPLMSKILKAFDFPPEQVYHCCIEEFESLQGTLPEFIWSTLGETNQLHGHKLLTSASISEMVDNPQKKKHLWEQFCAFK